MTKTINPNFIKASYLIFISAVLGLANFVFFSPPKSTYEITVGLVAIGFVIAIGFVVRKAYQWIKWVLLVITLLGVLGTILALPVILQEDLIDIILSLLQMLLQIAAVILLFLPDKSLANNIREVPEKS